VELGTIETAPKSGALLPTLVSYIPRKGQVDWLFLGTRQEARVFIDRKVAEGYKRGWLWTSGATPTMVDAFRERMAQAA
jgi:hypothetical protein